MPPSPPPACPRCPQECAMCALSNSKAANEPAQRSSRERGKRQLRVTECDSRVFSRAHCADRSLAEDARRPPRLARPRQ
eukprot:912287-Rhodomonas_salina.2